MTSIKGYIDYYAETIPVGTKIVELARKMKYQRPPFHHIYVVDNNVPIGVLDIYNPFYGVRGNIEYAGNPRDVRVEDIMRELKNSEMLLPTTRLKKAAKTIYEGELPGAPVIKRRDHRIIIGEVNRFGLLRAYQHHVPEDELVTTVIHDPISIFHRDTLISEILAWMRLQPTYKRYVIIVEDGGYDSRPIGIITMENLTKCGHIFRIGNRHLVTVEDVMVNPIIVSADTPARQVASMMYLYRTHVILVAGSDGSLMGVVTSDDILARLGKMR